jgi:integrase/recombinase XerD
MAEKPLEECSLHELVPDFLTFAQVELRFAPESIVKYRDCLRQVARQWGDKPITSCTKADLMQLKASMMERGLSVNRQVSILLSLKRFLKYAGDELRIKTITRETIIVPRRPRKEVAFLKPEEVDRFIDAIKLTTGEGHVYTPGLRFRALVEVLLGSAMRISEVLSLDHGSIDFKSAEARVVGKGLKERTVFFTDRALYWVGRYLEARTDDQPALFVTADGERRLKRSDIWRPFTSYAKRAGMEKRVTAHLLRHTAATQLLFNGCPIGHIKEILGHERLETTCRYYLGLDHRAAKAAHRKYLVYQPTES